MRRLLLLTAYLLFCVILFAQTAHFIPSDRFSSSLISDVAQDRQGSMWVATDYGLNRFDGYHFQTFLHDENDKTSLQVNVIVKLFCDREGRFWVGTNRGLDRFDAACESFVHYSFPNQLTPRVSTILQRHDGTILVGTDGYGAFSLGDDQKLHPFSMQKTDQYFKNFFEDSRGRLWKSGFDDHIAMRNGQDVQQFRSTVGIPQDFIELDGELLILCLHGFMSFRNGIMKPADIDMSAVKGKDIVFTTFAANNEGAIYVGTRGRGLYRISADRPRRLERVNVNAFGLNANTAMVGSAIFDRHGNLWLGCQQKGLLMVPSRPVQFKNWSFEAQGIRLGSPLSSVCEGDGDVVWCTVRGVGVYGFNNDGHVIAHPSAPDAVEFIYRDNRHNYWVGTNDGLYAYEPLTGKSQLKASFECDKFYDMTCDDRGNLYISTFAHGFCVYNPESGELVNHNFYEKMDEKRGRLCNNWIMSLSPDHQGNIWMGTASGVCCYDYRNDSFKSQGWNSLLDGVVCFEVCELHAGQLPDGRQLNGCIAIGTEEGLYLYDRKAKKAEVFPGSEQLRNKAVSYIVQSNDGDIWCSTSMGIWQYSQSSHTFIGHVNGNGLIQKEYLYGVGMHTDNDVVFFGHNDGLVVFQPARVKESHPSLDSLQLTAFYVGNQAVTACSVLNDVQVTDCAVSESESFTLSYLDHTITLAFSQLNFENPTNVTYEYKVNDGTWIRNPEGKNEITLGHLQPGTYKITVRALQGNDFTPEKTITVTVKAPWYSSGLAYLIYILAALSLMGFAAWSYRRRAHRRMDEEKMKFLINATHDIRSPLTLIMSPLQNLKRRLDTAQTDAHRDVDTIERNAQRILNLVNQILDVRKIDKQLMSLHCQKTDFVAFARSIYKMYEYNAQEHHIQYVFNSGSLESLDVWLDRGQFDKVITNLLSNAFKYSVEGGTIEMRVYKDDQNAMLEVLDTGMGLDNDNLKHIFERFYQGSNSRRLHVNGTGIGLNLCKMIVDLHHGGIVAHNRTDGQRGASFVVSLPLGNEHLKPEEIEEDLEVNEAAAAPAAQGAGKSRVLIVDDDEEIGKYISTELGRYYKFTMCSNGRDGLKELLTNEYDLVLSDVMMPEMDGFTMLRMIKTNINISDIPVIMLTSKADVGNRLEGLERGADAFLAKPFDMEELHLNIENLIHGRQRLKGKYSGAQQQAERVEQPQVKGNDELLMERIMKAINKNLSDSDFNVDMLTQEVGISRAQLHRKMKEMTGISTSEFLRNIRLEQAARLLREQKINVTQVAYTVGFSNLAHFSTIFRKHFGMAPSEYAEKAAER